MAGNSNKMMGSEDSFVSATTDVAAVSPEKQPIITPEAKAPDEETPEEVEAEADGSGENDENDEFGAFLSLIKNDDCDVPAAAAEEEDDDDNTANDKDKEVVSHGDMYIGLVDTSSPTQEDAAVAPATVDDDADDTPSSSKSNTTDGEAPDLAGPSAPATEEGAVAEGEKHESLNGEEKVDPSVTRRSSNAKKIELHSQNLLDSVTSLDSWGGKSGSLPPLSIPHRNTMPEFATTSATLLAKKENNVSSLDDDNSINSDPTGSSPSPQDKAPEPLPGHRSQSWSPGPPPKQGAQGSDGKDEVDQVANYVNFNQLLQPSSSSEYYYSQANRSNRHMLDKLNSKKNLVVSIDESHHSRSSVLSERSRASSYRGPTPLMRDGSTVKSLIKTRALSTTSERRMSVDSLMSPVSPEVSPEEDSESKTGSIKRCIFSCVDIREHERIAGDNPCVTSGVPLSIGWGYYQHDSITLDDYELNKGMSRDKIEMMVPACVRRQMLRDEFGVTITEMNAAMKQVNITKRQRRHTVGMEHLEGWQEVGQSAKRKVKRFVKGTSTAKEEEKMWAQARRGAMKEYLKTHGEAKNPESPGVGIINNGSKIAPENGQAAPFLEIIFQEGEGEGGAPSF